MKTSAQPQKELRFSHKLKYSHLMFATSWYDVTL